MSIMKYFNEKARAAGKKTRVLVASAALAFGVAGGSYLGHEIAQNPIEAQVSQFTTAQVTEDMTERQFLDGVLPAHAPADPQQAERIAGFTAQIDRMAVMEDDMARTLAAVDFVNGLRLAQNLSEQDYKDLLADFDARVGLDVTPITGNYREGLQYWQEAQAANAFSMIFGDDDMTEAAQSKDIGGIMLEVQAMHAEAGMTGGMAGGLLGGLFVLPFALRGARRREEYIKLPLPPKP